jgi:hypothetical protein
MDGISNLLLLEVSTCIVQELNQTEQFGGWWRRFGAGQLLN